MGDAPAVGVIESGRELPDQIERLGHVEGTTDLDQFPQRLPLDKLHRDVAGPLLLTHVVDRHDVRVPQQVAHLAFVAEGPALLRIGRVAASQHLDRQNAAGVAMNGPIHPRERAGADLIEHLGVAVEIAPPLPLEQPLELIAGQEFPPHEHLPEGFRRTARGFPQGLLHGGGGHEFQLADEKGEIVGGIRLHRRRGRGLAGRRHQGNVRIR